MTQTVFDQIMEIRSGGLTNMLDINAVQRLAFDAGLYEMVVYIEEDKSRYFHFILTGTLPEGEENPATSTSTTLIMENKRSKKADNGGDVHSGGDES